MAVARAAICPRGFLRISNSTSIAAPRSKCRSASALTLSPGLLKWAQHISDVMFESQSIIADVQARYLLPGGYLRINPKLGRALALDDIARLNDLKNISDITRTDEVLIKKFFLEG